MQKHTLNVPHPCVLTVNHGDIVIGRVTIQRTTNQQHTLLCHLLQGSHLTSNSLKQCVKNKYHKPLPGALRVGYAFLSNGVVCNLPL